MQSDDGFDVTVPTGPRARTVQVLHTWTALLHASLEGLLEGGVLLGVEGVTATVTQLKRLGDASNLEVHVSLRRLRTTWLVRHLTVGTPLPVLLAAAGLTNAATVLSLVEHIPTIDTDVARRHLLGQAP